MKPAMKTDHAEIIKSMPDLLKDLIDHQVNHLKTFCMIGHNEEAAIRLVFTTTFVGGYVLAVDDIKKLLKESGVNT